MDREKIKHKFNGRCAYCGVELKSKFHVDHVEPLYRNCNEKEKNNSEENLYPACIRCNMWKKVYTLDQFREEISKQVDAARRYSKNFRLAEDFGLIKETGNEVQFYFEKTIQY